MNKQPRELPLRGTAGYGGVRRGTAGYGGVPLKARAFGYFRNRIHTGSHSGCRSFRSHAPRRFLPRRSPPVPMLDTDVSQVASQPRPILSPERSQRFPRTRTLSLSLLPRTLSPTGPFYPSLSIVSLTLSRCALSPPLCLSFCFASRSSFASRFTSCLASRSLPPGKASPPLARHAASLRSYSDFDAATFSSKGSLSAKPHRRPLNIECL